MQNCKTLTVEEKSEHFQRQTRHSYTLFRLWLSDYFDSSVLTTSTATMTKNESLPFSAICQANVLWSQNVIRAQVQTVLSRKYFLNKENVCCRYNSRPLNQ